MGDPKKQRKKYSKPNHPWQKERIEEERTLSYKYGLKNKKEIWKASSFIKNMKDFSKSISASRSEQAKKEEAQILSRLVKLGILSDNATLSDILGLTTESVLERRLQTVIFKKGLARTVNQARQMITHGHISVNGKKITFPSYLIPLSEEAGLAYTASSNFNKADHPELNLEVQKKEEVKEEAKEAKKHADENAEVEASVDEAVEETAEVAE